VDDWRIWGLIPMLCDRLMNGCLKLNFVVVCMELVHKTGYPDTICYVFYSVSLGSAGIVSQIRKTELILSFKKSIFHSIPYHLLLCVIFWDVTLPGICKNHCEKLTSHEMKLLFQCVSCSVSS
jgi:hypothetical protein